MASSKSWQKIKWLYLVMTILFYQPLLVIALDDSGSTFAYVMEFPFIILAVIFSILTLISWGKTIQRENKKTNLLFISFLPILLIVFFGCIQYNRLKSERRYFLFAKDPVNPHDFTYSFRDDSLMKVHGVFKVDDADFYQSFRMQGDTLIFDTILPRTNLISKKYIKTTGFGKAAKVLIPLAINGTRMDTSILQVEVDREF
jgi:hypothetical protein